MSLENAELTVQNDGHARAACDDLDAHWRDARRSDAFMVAIWYVEDGTLNFFRQTKNFPRDDFDQALTMLDESLKEPTS